MNGPRRAEVRVIVDQFRGRKPEYEEIEQFCKRLKMEPVTPGELDDYTAQLEHDEVVSSLFPKILSELQKLRYEPEFAPEAERKAAREANDEVRVSITKLFEQHALSYRLVDGVANELGQMVGQTIAMAGTTAFNKALDVLLHLARERFGADFNMKHAADYVVEVMEKHHGEKVDKEG